MADANNIEFQCQECNAKISFPSKKSGQRVICPSCVRTVVVPEVSVASALFEDIFDEETSELKLSPIEPGDSNNSNPEPPPIVDEAPIQTPASDGNGLELADDDNAEGDLETAVDDALTTLPAAIKDDPNAPLRIEGLEGLYGEYSAHSVTCRVCDSLIHIESDKIDTSIECPECFTKIHVEPPAKRKAQKPIWQQATTPETSDASGENAVDDELRLSDPIEKPKLKIDPTYGLDGPAEDLLAPKTPTVPEQTGNELELEPEPESEQSAPKTVVASNPTASQSAPSTTQKNKSDLPPLKTGRELSPKSRRERFEKSQQQQRASEQGTVFSHSGRPEDMESKDFPATDLGTQFKSALQALIAKNTIWRFAIAMLLMCTGAVVMESISPSAVPPEAELETGLAEQFFTFATWFIVGCTPYLLGWLMLLYTSAYLFRDAALGYRTVNSWKNSGFNELSSTILVFGFSFVAAGIIMLFLPVLKLPMQLLLAPLLLTSAWYSRSPFNVANIDAFQTSPQVIQLWKSFYQLIIIFVIAALFSGCLLLVRSFAFMPPAFSIVLTIPGVFLNGLITTLFAATCGWHCGRISIESLDN